MRTRILVITGAILVAGVLAFAQGSPAGAASNDPRAGETDALQRRVAASFAQTGQQHLSAGRFEEAIEDFRAALSFDPEHAAARKGLAEAQAKAASVAQARAKAQQKTTPPAKPANDDLIRAQASLKVMCASARRLLEKGEYRAAASMFDKALLAARPLARHIDVSAIEAEANHGLQLAREGMRAAAMPTAPAREEPEPKAEPAEKKAAPEDEYEAAMEEAIREVGRMMRPQTRILAKADLPDKMTALTRSRRDHTTETIGSPDFQGSGDESAEKLIKAKLLKKVSVNFKGESFAEAVGYIRAASDVNILVDPAILPATVPVHDFTVVDMELRYVLDWLLRFQRLDYRIRQGAIFISNSEGLAERPLTVLHDIADLTVRVRDFTAEDGLNVMRAPKYEGYGSRMGIDRVRDDQVVLERTRLGQEWAEFMRKNVAPSTWSGEGGEAQNTIAYRNGKLVVTHTPEVQEQIRELLGSFRKARAIQVAILARFVEISEDSLEELGVRWEGLEAGGGEDAGGTFGIVDTAGSGFFRMGVAPTHEVGFGTAFLDTTGLTVEAGFLRNWQVKAIVTAVRKQRKGNLLTAPRVTCFNTQRAFMTVSTIQNFVRSYDSDGNPEIGQVNDGIVLEVQPFVSADRRYITLELIPQVNMVGDFQEFAFRRDVEADDDDDAEEARQDTIQLPEVTTRQVMTTVSVPDGGTLLIGGLAQAREAEGYATVPFLGDLPLLKYLFRSRGKVDSRDNLIILVTAHIIQQEED